MRTAPFRAEHIGSLLRPQSLIEERAKFRRGEISASKLKEAEELAIKEALALQDRLGFKLATDGEFRRSSYHSYFYSRLGDISIDTVAVGSVDLPGHRGAQPIATIKSRVQWTGPINAADFEFIRANTTLVPKITIPGPCALHFRGGNEAVLASAYKEVDQFWDDIVAAFEQELGALAEAGCRYVQIDETAFAKFGDPEVQASLKARGDDWSALIDTYVAITNRVLARAPTTMQIGMHLCRGNRGGQWHRGQLQFGGGATVQRPQHPVLFSGVQFAAGRDVHLLAARASAQKGRSGPRFDQVAGTGKQRRSEKAA